MSSVATAAAPNPDARLLLPRYKPIITFPMVNSNAVTAAPVQTSRQGMLARATHFVFDKTGTLTSGQMRVLEGRNALYDYIPADTSKIILTELIFPGSESVITHKIATVEAVQIHSSSMTALVTTAQVF